MCALQDGWTDIIRNLQQLLAKATREMRDAGASPDAIRAMRRRVQCQQMEKVKRSRARDTRARIDAMQL